MNASTSPALPEDLDRVLRRMRLPYLRKAAPEVLATARAQRWDPAEGPCHDNRVSHGWTRIGSS